MFGLGFGEAITVVTVGAAVAAAIMFPASVICRKLGSSPWLGVLFVVPVLNILLLWYLAFALPAAQTSLRTEP